MNKTDILAVNTLRALSLDMICKANSGHPGMALSSAPIIYTLFSRHLVSDPKHPNWINRDRFVLSAGHGSALLYSTLHLAGYSVTLDQLKQFRQYQSLTPGHPELGHTPGVDATAGPLGQGIAQAVGMAMAEKHLQFIYPEGERLIDHYTYCLCGDGCLQEGVSQEAISLAALFHLNKFILLYDKNDCTLDGPLSNSSIEDTKARFKAAGWNTLEVMDGNDVEAIDKAINLAKTAKERPTIIIVHTIIGYGSPYQNSNVSHGKAFSSKDVSKTKENLSYPYAEFEIPEESYSVFKETFIKRGEEAYENYIKDLDKYKDEHHEDYTLFSSLAQNDVRQYIFKNAPSYDTNYANSTRNESQEYLNLIAEEIPNLFGGSADVQGSVMTKVKKFTDFSYSNPKGENINFGIREFAMGAIGNGILLHGGLRSYVGAFLVFADYLKPAIRMAAMEKIPSIFLFSHDSIAVGEDGPTHQPIEQLTMLRSIPDLVTFRPADAIEVALSYQEAFSSNNHPTAIILSRQNLPNNEHSSLEQARKGGYVISKELKENKLTLLASGSEVSLAIEIQKELLSDGIDTRVISLPCLEIFDKQSEEYKEECFNNPYEKRIFIEMGKSDLLYKYAKTVYGIDTYGLSAKAKDVIDHFGFTKEKLVERIKKDFKDSL